MGSKESDANIEIRILSHSDNCEGHLVDGLGPSHAFIKNDFLRNLLFF